MSEYEKIRYERLRLVCTKALEESIKKSLSLDQIKICYPTIASTAEGIEVLEIARSQIIDFWLHNSIKEFDLIFQERNLEEALNSLDEIVFLAKKRSIDKSVEPIEIDKLTPKDIIDAKLNYKRNETVNALKLIYDQLCIDNLNYFQQLNSLCQQSEDIKTDINNQVTFLNQELEVLKNDNSSARVNELLDTIADEI